MSDHGWTALVAALLLFATFRWTGHVRFHRRSRAERDGEAERAVLEARLGTLDQLEARVAELENRLDFTERLLSQRSEVDRTS